MISKRLSLATTTLLTVFACDVDLRAQRGRRRGRGRPERMRPEQPSTPPPKKEKPKGKPVAYTNAVVHVGNTTVLRRATVLTHGGKITEVGRKVELPKDTKIVDCSGKHICPGFIIHDLSGVGLSGRPGKGESFRDSIDPYNSRMKRALGAGITSYLTMSGSRGGMPTGTSAILKIIPESIDDVVVKESACYGISVPLGLSGWKKFNDTLESIGKYEKDLAEYEKKKAAGDKTAKPPKKPSSFDEISAIKKGKARLRISGSGGGGRRSRMPSFGGGGAGMNVKLIREALRIAKALGVGVTLNNATEGWIVADEIAQTGSSCTLMPRIHSTPDPTRTDKNGSSIHAAAILAEAGVPVAVLPPGGIFGSGIGDGGILGRDLNTPTLDPCFAIRGGMDEKEALSTITLYPAMMMGVGDRIGSLEAGKDADLLILDGDPLHYKTFVQRAIVNGKVVYEKDKEPFFRHIRPGKAKR